MVAIGAQQGGGDAESGVARDETVGLGPGMGGRWLVRTKLSEHLWDLDQMTYTRRAGPQSVVMAYDNVEVAITAVDLWPRVGGRSLVWFDDPQDPTQEQWRLCSAIRSITLLAPKAAPVDTSSDIDIMNEPQD
ncbi:hypothetical protein [Pedococcus soli]